ncbi:hypothetical protein FRC03_004384 [Tulasnella sp. 419]|nr:hypothetical protein FRC03_004384 [Tulasnella sp. 419]
MLNPPPTPIRRALSVSPHPLTLLSPSKIPVEFSHFNAELKHSRNLLTYNTVTGRAEVWKYPCFDLALECPVPFDVLVDYCGTHDECELPRCWCPHLKGPLNGYARSYHVKFFICRNNNPTLQGMWIAACAERYCGYFKPLGRSDVDLFETHFFRDLRPDRMFYLPSTVEGDKNLLRYGQTVPPSSSSLIHALDESMVIPASQQTVPSDPDELEQPTSVIHPQQPQTPTPKPHKDKGKGRLVSKPLLENSILPLLSKIPDLSTQLAVFLEKYQETPSKSAGTTVKSANEIGEDDLYYKSPSGALTGPLSPSKPSYQQSLNATAGPSGTKCKAKKDHDSAKERAKKLKGVFKKRTEQPVYPLNGAPIAAWFQLNDDDFPGIPPDHFVDVFWQCDLCDIICLASKMDQH